MEACIRRDIIVVISVGLILSIVFLCFKNTKQKDQYLSASLLHSQAAYNFLKYGSFNLNQSVANYLVSVACRENRLVDFSEVPDDIKLAPNVKFPIQDTIGYSLVLAGLWKITGSFKFLDVQILQIFLYLISLILVYFSGLYLFKNRKEAFFSILALLLFFPIPAMMVKPARNVWAYYGSVLFLYALVRCLRHKIKPFELVVLAILFAFCQWVRPTVFFILPATTLVLIVYNLFKKLDFKFFQFLIVFWLCSFSLFWVPFMTFNKINYKRFFVAPVGQDLLEGLGEYPNNWGLKLSDTCFKLTIKKIDSSVKYGTPEFDDKGKELFWKYFKEDPFFYFKSLFKRLGVIALPSLEWLERNKSPYYDYSSCWEKLKCALSSSSMALDFVLRHVYIRLFILVGYLGFILLLFKKKRLIVLIFVGILLGGLSKFPSHIEYKYLVPFWWVFSFGVGYLFAQIFKNKEV